MFVPMWIVWVVGALVAAPVLYFVIVLPLAFAVAMGKDAQRNDRERAAEAADRP